MKKRTKQLPRTWQGAAVARGGGMPGDAFDDLLRKKACDAFRPTQEQWLVIEDNAVRDLDGSTQVRLFGNQTDALRCAKALSNGNVDHRVIRLAEQTLVVATMNSL